MMQQGRLLAIEMIVSRLQELHRELQANERTIEEGKMLAWRAMEGGVDRVLQCGE